MAVSSRMKAGMSNEGYKALVRELARVFRTGEPFDTRVLDVR